MNRQKAIVWTSIIGILTNVILVGFKMLVGVIIFVTGGMALFESFPKIIHPELADYSWATIVVVVAAVIAKLFLGIYVRRAGKRFDSGSLLASGLDALFMQSYLLAPLSASS